LQLPPSYKLTLNEVTKRARVVGIWDFDSSVGALPEILQQMNQVQRIFVFVEVIASPPSGLAARPEAVISWLRSTAPKLRLTKADRREIKENVIANAFFRWAKKVQRDLGVDYLVGITSGMVAGVDEEGTYWNHFASTENKLVLVSAYKMFDYAKQARRPYEAAVAGLVVSGLLALTNPSIEYHEETNGCLFDYNDDRDTIVKAIRHPTIDAECLKSIRPKYRDAALALLHLLKTYRGKGSQ
jgi:hypothetical protein